MMTKLVIDLPFINPIAFQLGAISIHWYGIMYLLGFLLGYFAFTRKDSPLRSRDQIVDYIFYVAIGVILGGRIGFIIFYNLAYYLQNPGQILAVWQGGMSFHGGLLGVIIATYLFSKKYKKTLSFFQLTDYLVLYIPFTLALGRIGNFINGELYGRLSTLPWAMHFPHANGYRHPSQLYEALLHIIFAILLISTKSKFKKGGIRSGIFLIGYSLIRTFVEFFREPDQQIGFIADIFTMGQLLSIPMLVAGIVILISIHSRRK